MGALEVTGPEVLVRLKRSELSALFHDGSSSVPDGHGRGTLLVGSAGWVARATARLVYLLVWRGKLVDARAGRLENLITPLAIPAVAAQVYEDRSWYDGEVCVVLDYSKTSMMARWVRDEIREVGPGVFVGLVFVGQRLVLHFSLDFTGHRRAR